MKRVQFTQKWNGKDRGANRGGFFLIESLVVLALLAVITVAVYPQTRKNRDYLQLEVAAKTLLFQVRAVQSHAVTTNITARLVFYYLENCYYLELSGEKKWVWLPAGVKFAAINFPEVYSRHTLSFNSLGTPNQGGHVGLKGPGGKKLYIIVTPVTGRVRIAAEPP